MARILRCGIPLSHYVYYRLVAMLVIVCVSFELSITTIGTPVTCDNMLMNESSGPKPADCTFDLPDGERVPGKLMFLDGIVFTEASRKMDATAIYYSWTFAALIIRVFTFCIFFWICDGIEKIKLKGITDRARRIGEIMQRNMESISKSYSGGPATLERSFVIAVALHTTRGRNRCYAFGYLSIEFLGWLNALVQLSHMGSYYSNAHWYRDVQNDGAIFPCWFAWYPALITDTACRCSLVTSGDLQFHCALLYNFLSHGTFLVIVSAFILLYFVTAICIIHIVCLFSLGLRSTILASTIASTSLDSDVAFQIIREVGLGEWLILDAISRAMSDSEFAKLLTALQEVNRVHALFFRTESEMRNLYKIFPPDKLKNPEVISTFPEKQGEETKSKQNPMKY